MGGGNINGVRLGVDCCIRAYIHIFHLIALEPMNLTNPMPPIIVNPLAELSARRDSIVQTIAKLT
jgi:hypothetical protein